MKRDKEAQEGDTRCLDLWLLAKSIAKLKRIHKTKISQSASVAWDRSYDTRQTEILNDPRDIILHAIFKIAKSTKRFLFFGIYVFIMFLHTCMFPACCFRQRTYMAQGLVNGVLNETWTQLCLQFEWFSVGLSVIILCILRARV